MQHMYMYITIVVLNRYFNYIRITKRREESRCSTLRWQIFFFKLAVIVTLALLAGGVDMFEAAQHLMIENGWKSVYIPLLIIVQAIFSLTELTQANFTYPSFYRVNCTQAIFTSSVNTHPRHVWHKLLLHCLLNTRYKINVDTLNIPSGLNNYRKQNSNYQIFHFNYVLKWIGVRTI